MSPQLHLLTVPYGHDTLDDDWTAKDERSPLAIGFATGPKPSQLITNVVMAKDHDQNRQRQENTGELLRMQDDRHARGD